MHRTLLLDVLERLRCRHPEDGDRVARIAGFARAHAECFERRCVPGHITGSAWVLSPDRTRVLLTHHRKLGRWLQVGGHADGDPDPFRVALREAREESGLTDLHVPPELIARDGLPLPLDVDVHEIPARALEPAHLHHDIRYLLVAGAGQEIRCSEESNELRWFDLETVDSLLDDDSLLRLARRSRQLLWRGETPGRP